MIDRAAAVARGVDLSRPVPSGKSLVPGGSALHGFIRSFYHRATKSLESKEEIMWQGAAPLSCPFLILNHLALLDC